MTYDGKWLRSARERLRLTQADLGAILGVTHEHVCRMERGGKAVSRSAISAVTLMQRDPKGVDVLLDMYREETTT